MTRAGMGAKGANSAQLRQHNERIVLQVLRRAGEASKADLARAANLTNAAIGGIIQNLEAAGLIDTVGKRHEGRPGQPATMLRLDPTGAYGVGVRLDRTSIETVLIDFEARLIARRTHDMTLPPPRKALEIVRRDIASVIDLLPVEARDRVAGIGVAHPYNISSWMRELGMPGDTFRQWDGFDFAGELERETGIAVVAENDGTAAAIAELFHGIGRREDDFFYLFIGPATGGGVVVGGDVIRGLSGNAGDVAVMPVPPSKLASAPKPLGTWEILLARASLNALVRHLRHGGQNIETRSDIEVNIERGEPLVEEWLEDCVDALVPTIRSAIALLDLPTVVIDADVDGGLITSLLGKLSLALAANMAEARLPPTLARGSFGADAGAVGAASLPLFFNFSPRAALARHAAPGFASRFGGGRDHVVA